MQHASEVKQHKAEVSARNYDHFCDASPLIDDLIQQNIDERQHQAIYQSAPQGTSRLERCGLQQQQQRDRQRV